MFVDRMNEQVSERLGGPSSAGTLPCPVRSVSMSPWVSGHPGTLKAPERLILYLFSVGHNGVTQLCLNPCLEQQSTTLSQFWRLEVENQGVHRAVISLRVVRKIPPCLFQTAQWSQAVLGILRLWLPDSHFHMAFLVCVCVCVCLRLSSSSKNMRQIGFRSHPTPV